MTTLADLEAYATQQAENFGIPPSLFLWQINQESGFNPNPATSINPVTGNPIVGIAQFDSATAASLGIDPNDPLQSLYGAAKYDAQLLGDYGTFQGMLSHYGTAFTPTSPQSVNDAANAAIANAGPIGYGGPQGTAAVNYFANLWNGILNSFGFGPGVPTLHADGTITPASPSNNQRGNIADIGGLTPQSYITRGTAIVVGLIMLAGALYLFGSGKTPIVIKKALAS